MSIETKDDLETAVQNMKTSLNYAQQKLKRDDIDGAETDLLWLDNEFNSLLNDIRDIKELKT